MISPVFRVKFFTAYSDKETAAELGHSEETLVVHIRHLFAKLGVNDGTAAPALPYAGP